MSENVHPCSHACAFRVRLKMEPGAAMLASASGSGAAHRSENVQLMKRVLVEESMTAVWPPTSLKWTSARSAGAQAEVGSGRVGS